MRQENQHSQEPEFDDAKYSIDMRVDKLTTMDAMRQELSEIESNIRHRKEMEDKRKAEKEQAERAEFEAWKAEQKRTNNDQVE